MPNDKEIRIPNPKRHGTPPHPPPRLGSPSAPTFESDGRHFQGTDKSANEGERKYYLDLIAEFGLLVGKPSHIPLQPNAALSREPTDTDSKLKNIANPLKYHLDTALKVTKYLNGSPCKGLNIMKSYASGIELKAYSDADSARCVDKRGFVTGMTISQYRYATTSTCVGTLDREQLFTKAPVAIPATNLSLYLDSVKSPFSYISFFQASVNVIYPASVVDKASMCCKLAFKLPAHPSIINLYPVIYLPMTVINLPMT
ncbi:hypothetical protein Tco_0378612 [Tanacetum coccineum]